MNHLVSSRISRSAVEHNLQQLRRHAGDAVKLCAVVKADAYGHGIALLLDVLSRHSDMLAVATPAEALELRELGFQGPLLTFFISAPGDDVATVHRALAELIQADVTLTAVSLDDLSHIEAAAAIAGPARVHVKIDTGMHRRGALAADTPAVLEAFRHTEVLRLCGIYTHFATADEADKRFTREQFGSFKELTADFSSKAGVMLHAASSAAAIDLPETHMDMIRPGIAIYGYSPSDQLQSRLDLKPCMQIVASIQEIKRVPRGARSGYGLSTTFERDTRIGIVPVGYADGYPRSHSNCSQVCVHGVPVDVRGRVSMDQIVIDLGDVPQAHVGDEVEIVSIDPAAPNSIENLARLADTIPYELTCRLNGPRTQRVAAD